MSTVAPPPPSSPKKSGPRLLVIGLLVVAVVCALGLMGGGFLVYRSLQDVRAHMSPKSVSSEKVQKDYLDVEIGGFVVDDPTTGLGHLPVTVHNKHRDDWKFEVHVTAKLDGKYDFDDKDVSLRSGETRVLRFFDRKQEPPYSAITEIPDKELPRAHFTLLKAQLYGV